MANGRFIHTGDVLDHTPTSAVTSGDVVVMGDLIGIAERDIPANTLGAVRVKGVVELPKDNTVQIDKGDICYFEVAEDEINKTASGNPFAGVCVEDAATADETVKVLLNKGVPTAA